MRILCLHGRGQNGSAVQSELEPLLSKWRHLNAELTLDFIDGPLKVPNDSVKELVSREPHSHEFFEVEKVKDIRKSVEWLGAKLDQDGPYDGVLASSQGAARVSSFLLYRQWYDHELPPPFKFAIFIGGAIPLKVLKDLGVAVSGRAEEVVAQAKLQRDRALGPLLAHTARARRAVFDSDDCFGLNLNRIPLELKIRIPTVHVWGENDPMFPASVQLAGLCDPYIRKIQTHAGSRGVPTDEKDLEELVELMEWCVQRATWPGQKQL